MGFFFLSVEQWTVVSQDGEGKKIIVILACLSCVLIVERWLLRLFVLLAGLSEEELEEKSGHRRVEGKDKGTREPRRK